MSVSNLPLINTITQSVIQLNKDFTGINVNLGGFLSFVLAFIGAAFLFFLLYLVGYRIRSIFLKDSYAKDYAVFLSLVLGYALFGTGIALISMFSLLTPWVISLYLAVLTVSAFFPRSSLLSAINEFRQMFSSIIHHKRSFIDVVLLIFILIALLRLILPESTVDGVGYHLSYPKEYLAHHSLMIQSLGAFYFAAMPQLGEMLYVVAIAFGVGDATRIMHFFFYIAIVLMFIKMSNGKNSAGRFAALLFVTAPIVIKETSIAYTDFMCLFCWMVADCN